MTPQTTKKNLSLTNKIYDKCNEYPIDCEFTLPDYCPDIERILKCNIVSRISNLSVLSDSAQADINANINVLYTTTEGKIFGYEMPINLSKSINVGVIDKQTASSYSTKTEYVNCRAVNKRKIDVHGSISIMLCLVANDEKNYISDIEDESVVLKKQKEKILQANAFASKQVNVADDIIISGSSGSVSNIIRSDAFVVVDDCKTITNKAIAKLTVNYEILYLSTDLRYEYINHSVPINQIIDLENTDENSICKVNADICSVSFKTITNSEGEMRTINTSAKINVSVVSYGVNDIELITDGYSTLFESELERENLKCEKFISNINEEVSVGECINVSSQIGEIIDFKCLPLQAGFKTENGNSFICGDIAVCVSLEDENGEGKYYEKVISYKERISLKDYDENCEFDLKITPINCSYTISSGNAIDFRAELNVNGFLTKPINLNAVTSMKIDEEKGKPLKDIPSLVVYYGTAGENLWDIALKYNTSSDKICEANKLTKDTLTEDTMLLIPCM